MKPPEIIRRATNVVRAVFIVLLAAPSVAIAGSSTLSGNFAINGGTGINMWTGGDGFNLEQNYFLGPTWDESGGIGGIDEGLFGDRYGLELKGSTSGKAGFNLGVHATSGLITGTAPLSLNLSIPDSIRPGDTIKINSTVDNFAPKFQTISPDFGFRMDLEMDFKASASAYACFVECGGFNETLIDLTGSKAIKQELLSINYDDTAASIPDSYDQQVILFRGSDAIEANVTTLVLGAAQTPISLYENELTGEPIIALRYGSPGQTSLLPVVKTEGGLKSAGDAVIEATGQADLLSLSLNITQLANAMGLAPPLAGNLGALIKPSGAVAKEIVDNIGYNLLTVEAGVGLGIRQDFALDTPEVFIDLALKTDTGEILQTYTVKAGQEADITIPLSLFNLDPGELTFEPTIRFGTTSLTNDTQLAATPFVHVNGLSLSSGKLKLPSLFKETWKLPLPGITVFENQFDVEFTGTTTGSSLFSQIDFSRDLVALGPGATTDFTGSFVSKRITLAPSVMALKTSTDVVLLNSLLEHNAGAHLQVDHFLGFSTGSQLSIGDIRIGTGGVILGQDGQIGMDNAMTTIYNAGEIRVGENSIPGPGAGPGNIVIADAELRAGFGGGAQGTVTVFEFQNIAGINLALLDPQERENRLDLVDVGVFANSLDNLGRVDVNAGGVSKTRFGGTAPFSMPGFQNASIRNARFLNLVSGVTSIESGLLQIGVGVLSVASTLELRSHISGGEVELKPGAVLKLYSGSLIDGVSGMSGSSARIFALGDTTLRNSMLDLLGTSVDSGAVFSTDNTGFNEFGQPGVDTNPSVTLDSSVITIRNGLFENSAASRLVLNDGTIESSDVAGRPESDAGTINNFGTIDSTGNNSRIARAVNTNIRNLPALTNHGGSAFNQGTGTTVFEGGVLNLGAFNIADGGAVRIDAPLLSSNQARFAGASDFVVAGGVVDIAAGAELTMNAGAALVINGGDVNYRGAVLAGDIVQNSGTLLVDTAAPGANAFDADLVGNFDQRGGTLVIGANLSDGVFDISGLATLAGSIDYSASIPGVSFELSDGALLDAISYGARSGSFRTMNLPTIAPDMSLPVGDPARNGFYWLARYNDVDRVLRFRLTELGTIPVDDYVGGLLTGVGDDANEGETIVLTGEEGFAGAGALQIGNYLAGPTDFGELRLRDKAVLNTSTGSIVIEPNGTIDAQGGILITGNGTLDAQGGSVIRANGDIVVIGGELNVLDDGYIVAADGVDLIARDIANIRIDSGYEVPAGGRLVLSGDVEFTPPATLSANTVSIGGALDLSQDGNAEVLIENYSSLVAGINGDTSNWIAESRSGNSVVHTVTINGNASLTIGNIEARARFDPLCDTCASESKVTILQSGGHIFQTAAGGLVLGGPGVVGATPNAILKIENGALYTGGGGINRIGRLGKIDISGPSQAFFNSAVDLDGGQITVSASSDLRLNLNGHDLTASNDALVDLSDGFRIEDGTRVSLSERSRLHVGGRLSVGADGQTGITTELFAAGEGTTVTVGGQSNWGDRGAGAFVAFTDGARGQLQDINLALGGGAPNLAPTQGSLLVSGGFSDTPTRVTVRGINAATSDSSHDPQALIRVAEGAILEMMSGAHGVNLGHAGFGDTFRMVSSRFEVASGASFDGSLATGNFTANNTADVVVDGATIKLGGDLVLNGGQFFYRNPTAQSVFELPDDATITVKNAGEFNYGDTFRRDADLINIESGGRFQADRLLLPSGALTVSGPGISLKAGGARLTANSAVIAAAVTLEDNGTLSIEDRDFLFANAGALKIGKSDEGFAGTGALNVLVGGSANVIGNLRIGGLSSTEDAVGVVTLNGGSLNQEIAEGAFPQDGTPPLSFIFVETSIGSPFAGTESLLSVGTDSQFRGLDTRLRLLERGRVLTDGGEITVARIDFEGGTLDLSDGDVIAERTINYFDGSLKTGSGVLSTAEFNVHGALEIDDGMVSSDTLNVGGTLDLISGTLSAAAVDVGGILSVTGGTTVTTTSFNVNGTFDVDDGMVSASALQVGGTFNVHSGSISSVAFDVDGALDVDDGTILSDTLSIAGTADIHGGSVSSSALIVDGNLKLDGGSIATATFDVGGAFIYQSGSLLVTADDVVVGIGGQLGPAFELTAAHDLNVTQNVAVDAGATLLLSSNSVAAAAIVNDGDLRIGALRVASDVAMIHNRGLISGDGRIGAVLDNQAGGEVEALSGYRLRFTASSNTNAGQINLDEGSVEFTDSLSNMGGGFIGGSGLFATANGLVNHGVIEFSADSDIFGDVDNLAGGQLIASGHSTLTLFDDVRHNGAEIRANSGSSIVLLGGFTGAGALTGGGAFFAEGDLKPGNSPGLLEIDGNFALGSLLVTEIELGGLERGSQYDAIDVTGTLTLGGTLNVVLFDPGGGLFAPQLDSMFDIFDANSIFGGFADINLPGLQAGLVWDTSQLATTGLLRVAAVPLPAAIWMLIPCIALLIGRRRSAR